MGRVTLAEGEIQQLGAIMAPEFTGQFLLQNRSSAICIRLPGRQSIIAMVTVPYLGGWVEITHERERHIAAHHPDLLPGHREFVAGTLAEPDQVRRSDRFDNARLVSRWYDDLGRHVVVVVMIEAEGRNWVVTAYTTRRLAQGDAEWIRN